VRRAVLAIKRGVLSAWGATFAEANPRPASARASPPGQRIEDQVDRVAARGDSEHTRDGYAPRNVRSERHTLDAIVDETVRREMSRRLRPAQGSGLFDELFVTPVAISFDTTLWGSSFWLRFAFFLTADELGVRGKVLEAVAAKILQRLKLVLFHEGEESLAKGLDQLMTKLHHAGADLNRACTEEDKLSGVTAGLDSTDTGEGSTREFAADHSGQLHAHAQSDGLDRL
jgi:hypothetical protein